MDTKLFEQLLEEQKIDEASALLKEYFQQPLTEEEQGALYTAFAMAYMKVKNEVNKQYLTQLDEMAEILKDLQKAERALGDSRDLAHLRSQIKGE